MEHPWLLIAVVSTMRLACDPHDADSVSLGIVRPAFQVSGLALSYDLGLVHYHYNACLRPHNLYQQRRLDLWS